MLDVVGVSYRFPVLGSEGRGDAPALVDASLSTGDSEVVALVGSNGAGKSTLARICSGSLAPDEGRVLLDGKEADPAALRREVGFVRQDPESQLVAPDVFDEVAFGPCNLGLPESEVRRRVTEALALCGLEGFERRLVSELSGGELQRLAVAGVLAMRPRHLVLDEVTSQLDGTSRQALRRIVRDFAREGAGVLSVTHDVEEIACADRVVVMEGGTVAWEGTSRELFSDEALVRRLGFEGDRLAGALVALGANGCFDAEASSEAYLLDLAGREPARAVVRQVLGSAPAHADSRGVGGGAARPAEEADPTTGPVELDHVSVCYGGLRALDDVSLRCEPSRITLLVGPSGSGKSTAASVSAGLLEPDAGSVSVAGHLPRAGSVGLCLQRSEDQVFCDTVVEDVAFGPVNVGGGARRARELAERSLRALGVDEGLWERSPFALSGGQRRRVAIAGILAMRPVAYVFDEPTIGLDAQGREFLHGVVRSVADEGHVVMVVSHDVGEWLDVADDVVLLDAGRVAWRGTAHELVLDPSPLARAGVVPPLWLRMRQVACDGA